MVDKTEDVDIADSPPEPVAEPPRDAPITVYATLDEETPSATPVSQPADGGGDPDDSPQSGKRPSGRRHEPMDEAPVGRTPLLERLAREVEGSRQRIRRVGDRLSSANDTSSPESAVQSIHREIEATSTKVERLNRDLEANGSPTAIAVDVILEEQQRIVTGFEDLLGNED